MCIFEVNVIAMKLTKRGEYALRTLIRPGITDRQGEGVMSVTLRKQEKPAAATRKTAKILHANLADGFLAALLSPAT